MIVGERTSSWHDLTSLVRNGQVQDVRVSDELSPGGHGFSTVYVRWDHLGVHHVTEVRQVSSHQVDTSEAADVTATVQRAPSELLQELQPGLRIRPDNRMSTSDPVLGFEVPDWLRLGWLLLSLAALGLLVRGPEPWRATRWAWFWWLGNPMGTGLFLLLSGPVPGIPAPRDPRRRVTGGWSFLLMVVLASGAVAVWGHTLDYRFAP